MTAAAATWTKSASKDSTTTIARLVEGSGAHATPSSGYALYSGTGRSAAMPALRSGQEYTVVLFSVDSTGNISVAATKSIGTTATIVTAPSAPTIISAVAGDGSVTVAFTPPAKDGNSPVTSYTVKNLDGLQTVTGASSPLTLTGLKDGFGVRAVVYANNAAGSGDPGGAPVVEPITTVTPSMPQLLSDPGFEQGDSGWTPFFSGDAAQPQAVLSRVSSPVHGGSGALKVAASTQPDASSVGIRNDTAIVHAVGGGTYTASCWVRPTSTVDVSATLQDSTRTLYTTHWVAPAGKWTKVSVESLEMWTGENVTPVFSTSATTATGPVYFDDCSVTR